MKRIHISLASLIAFCAAVPGMAHAQDTTKRKSIDITSTFKPVLREAAKINFNAAPPSVDTSKPRLGYSIPVQNLFFTYQPAELKPVALQMDSITAWQYSNFIKVGIGNVHQPYVKAGFSFGDFKNTFFNVFADHYTSKGSLDFQKNSLTSVGAAMTYKTNSNLEINARLGFKSDDYYLYGFQPKDLPFKKSDLRQRFQTIEGKVDLRNIEPTEFGLNYHPNLRISVFNDNHSPKANETNTVLNLPLEKTFGEDFAFHLGATADLTRYERKLNTSNGRPRLEQMNNLYQVNAALEYKSTNLFIHGGITPSWEQKKFHMLPNIMADITTDDKQLTLQLGWIGYFEKGSYQRFAGINPWLAQPDSMLNTRVEERYAGLKGSVGNHFTYSAKFGLLTYRNAPLFVNDDVDGKTFLVRYEPKFHAIQLHTEAAYNVSETFGAKAGFTFNNYYNMKVEKKAWGMIPVELNAGLHWQAMKDLMLRTEFWLWDGARYLKNGTDYKTKAGLDLNAGAEFRITRNLNLWVQFNNILNNKYQRWNQYEVFGFNLLGGITYSFNQK
ncbi:hypothetical protein HHL16_20880 [Pseudoflavitalea sp. G-6-1-2]|uniref:hypothetical protein n=1 Tax=Pseudoflavitalea sp. G-6-1-2 TaxID=2728841 RepID=UPI001469C03C|nr:hypothetical protein [Pseudoflavitalea sp. G-6-1-2]NML23347.1 hypothetical protein [Pseudoflavitalea sp. G-6-1-2]